MDVDETLCPVCKGKPVTSKRTDSDGDTVVQVDVCSNCDGKGRIGPDGDVD
jgi:DnaJ-class molecular chaperone